MRKILLMLFVLIAVLAVKAQTDIILADYEAGSIYPDRTTGENWGNLQKNIANPLKDGVNGSDQVVSYNFADTWWGGVHLQNFDEPISLGVYPFVKMKILSDTAKSRQVEVMLKDINDLEKSVTFTLPATSFQSGGGWSDVTFDFSSIAQNTAISFIKEIRIRVEVWSPQGIFYFDDIRFTGPSLVVSSLTLFTESFSDNNWWGSFPAKNTLSFFRTACWGGSALTAPASHYTGTDSLCMDAYNWQPTCAYFYPASVRSTISYLTIKDIGIGGFLNLNVSYNFKWTTAPTSFASAPTIEYSLDGTSWTTVTTSSTLPTANDTWANNVTHPLTGVSGSNLFVRITNNTDGYFMVDEIKVAGDPAFVTSINVETQDGTNAIDVKGATKQMVATVLPSAAKQDVLWSSYNGTGKATLSATGELTAVKNGTVCVIARALDLYGTVRDTQEVVLTNQRYPVTSVDVTGTGGASTITTDNGTLQMLAAYTPNDADTLEVTWSIHPSDADSVTISATGLITAVRNSTVKVIATAKDADHKTDTMDVVITGQVIELESIAVTGSDITTDGGTSQMTATLTPADAENVAIVWSLSSAADSIKATITAGGLVEAFHDGLITVVATDGNSAISSTKDITISGQIVPVESITISTGSSTIIANNGTLTLLVEVLPVDASDKTVIWTIESADADTASIDAGTGEITAIRNGEITVRATSVENNSKYDETTVVITNQIVEPTALTIADATVNSNNTPVQLSIASSTPADADKSVNWSIISSDADTATISSDGLLTPIRNGKVTVKAVSTIVGSVIAEKEITITGQVVELESIAVTGSDITTNGGTSPMTATLTPVDADNVTIVWSLSSAADSAKATITAGGLVEAFRSGAITVVATDGNSSVFGTKTINISGQILVSAINLTTEGNATGIATNGGQLQVYAEVLPADARIKGIVWSIVNTGGSALVNQSGMVTAVADGDVYVKATATDDGAYSDSILLSINGQVSVASVTIVTGSTTIDVNDGTLALSTEVLPTDASNKNVIWSIESDDADTASINTSTGVIKAIRNGELTVRATSLANASKFDEVTVVITNQIVEPIAIDIISVNGDSTIISNDGTLALSVNATPTDAVNDVVWSLSISDMEKAMIDSEGLVTAFRNGVIFVQVTSTVAPVSSSFEITIINQIVEPTAITVKGEGNATTITTDGGTLQMEASFAPADADNIVTWSIAIDDAALATISETGLLTAIMNGTVTVVATSNVDGTIKGEAEITISGQTVLVSSITVTGAGDATTITTNAGTLQMSAAVLPADATDKTFDWSVVNGTGEATISASGLLAAVKNGTVTVKATAKDGSLIEGSLVITISGQTVLVSSIAVTGAGDAT
ncbi:MAG: Ig-like domain-containing protein, partial [Salinivirgaceae bacterium]